MTDEARIRQLREAIAAKRAECDEERAFVDALVEKHPLGLALAAMDGSFYLNDAGQQLTGADREIESAASDPDALQGGWFDTDKTTPLPPQDMPVVRALTTRSAVKDAAGWMVSAAHPEGAWLTVDAYPLADGRAIAQFRLMTEEWELRAELESHNAELEEEVRESDELSTRLEQAFESLSTPVIELWNGVLAVPLIGALDTDRSNRMRERLLGALSTHGSRFVILDLTGVDAVDTATANTLRSVATSVRLLGSECVISGVQPAVAQTLVMLGEDLPELVTARNLAHALRYCLHGST